MVNCPFAVFGTLQNGVDGIANTHPCINERDAKSFNGQFLDIQNSFVIFDGSINNRPDDTRTIVIDIYYSRIDLDKKIVKN